MSEKDIQIDDEELLELAARAAGYTLKDNYDDHQYNPWCVETDAFWNPLLDNGDAFGLMVKLRINVALYDKWVSVNHAPLEYFDADPYAAVRRAIVRDAADTGKIFKRIVARRR